MQIDGYHIDIFFQGFPGKSLSHGGLGWSTVALLRGHKRVALIDTGSFGMRALLGERLAQRGLKPSDVTDVLLTHAHYDHMANWTLFRGARIVIGAQELAWATEQPWGETPVAELYARELMTWPSLHLANDGEEVMPRITAQIAPGHTPGHLIFVLGGSERDVIFVGDAAKNRAELICRRTDKTYDPAVSAASIETIWKLWRSRAGNIVVPGHDIPMVQNDGRPEYVGKRDILIKAWFGDDLETTTSFELTVG
jgi:N-acyl homoserine lactone hydrolase